MEISTVFHQGVELDRAIEEVVELEAAGVDRIWVAELYGFDSPSLMGFLAARTSRIQIASGILPLYARTPASTAMTAAGLDALSHGRFELGLGASGPQVVEGWHGVAYDAPLSRTREVVSICRQIWERQAPLVHEGRHYHVPLPPGQGTGLGKPLKIISHPVRPSIPIWVAALGEKNVALAAEIADGWLPMLFIPERAPAVWGEALQAGTKKRPGTLPPLRISAGGGLAIGESPDVLALRERWRPMVALYIGGMGARGRNFYTDLAIRYGFEREALAIQDLYVSGKRAEAEALVPSELLSLTSLIGPRSWVEERVDAMRQAGVTDLQVTPIPVGDQTAADVIATLRDIIG